MNPYEIAIMSGTVSNDPVALNTFSNLETADGKKMLYEMQNGNAAPLKDAVNTEFEIAGFLVRKSQAVDDETGEIKTVPLSFIKTTDGRTFAGQSVGIFQSLLSIHEIFGDPENWEAPVKVRCVNQSTKRGTMLKLNLV